MQHRTEFLHPEKHILIRRSMMQRITITGRVPDQPFIEWNSTTVIDLWYHEGHILYWSADQWCTSSLTLVLNQQRVHKGTGGTQDCSECVTPMSRAQCLACSSTWETSLKPAKGVEFEVCLQFIFGHGIWPKPDDKQLKIHLLPRQLWKSSVFIFANLVSQWE